MLRYNVYLLLLLIITSCSIPKAVIQVSEYDVTTPDLVHFNNLSKNAEHYNWDFGDGTHSNDVNPQHRYLNSGRYKVKLSAAKDDKVSHTETEVFIHAPQSCLVVIHTTVGDMIAQLYGDTPLHQENFLKLAEEGYFNGILFHRVIKGFMIQTGDPDSRTIGKGKELGKGGPDYTIRHEIKDTLFHVKGALAAARLSDEVNPDKASSGSQFYIVHGRPHSHEEIENHEYEKNIRYTEEAKDILKSSGGAPVLDKEYTIFGQIIEGIEVIDTIAESRTDHRDRPHEDIKILKITVIR